MLFFRIIFPCHLLARWAISTVKLQKYSYCVMRISYVGFKILCCFLDDGDFVGG